MRERGDGSPTRLALVGCGWISESHIGGYRALFAAGCRSFAITACCDLNRASAERAATAIAGFQGARPAVFGSVEELLESQAAEAADVCVPHCFHHGAAVALLRGGLHVQCEKPLGITVRASRAIIAAARAAQRVLATAENTRRSLGARAAVWAVRQGLIGEPVHGVATIARDDGLDVADPKWAWRNVKLLNGGGTLIDSGAHFADMMLQLFGPLESATCRTHQLREAPLATVPVLGQVRVDVEDGWHAHLRFASGMEVSWTHATTVPGLEQNAATYYGRSGALIDQGEWILHPFEAGAVVRGRAGSIERAALEQRYLASLGAAERARLFPHGVTDSFAIEIWDYIDAIRSGCAPELDGESGLAAKALCLTCYESAALEGAPVRYQDVLAGRVDAYQRPIDRQWSLLEARAG
jgi:UDP-N-acetyl-2-amino-2-deoxyglucuronate dehydrogenase